MSDEITAIQVKEGDDLFIDLVKARKNAFNLESSDYKDSNVVENVMKEISKIMNESGILGNQHFSTEKNIVNFLNCQVCPTQ